ncbi:monocarboxylate transporter 14 isoform X2 [Aedes albopictus]|uniref:Monocarboxylate transporter n=1 Tax=Aedes albopictus TaxID=7160 RepID=A0ABM1Z018_AEDAL|nr:monocarboxylate transporter 14 isoform X2 [Aedes albopictus]XP_029717166.1 monocarboxylate transporter 14 isoform X2 [Aedes albopictus]XP_029717167.1 monocarboxylate transporter 14 isoform X2 [Aedes albopictus]XP_029717168.1 monocarboxylate transporter 14 isoform X2 [Aedes albopictus]XP_029717169.1 monocarboxylate transporter 14 isoform X2 [Aedes albopictus]XP_029718900.1 monocarboxylate transporter 14-like isoform X2 [Aedes albopictus]XP_029718901.1 monocarboxylate transporter 14-like iso
MSSRKVRKVTRTDSDIACEEASRLTADLQDEASPEDDDGMCEYHDMPPPPDGGYGWVIVFASFMCNMIVDGIAYTFGVFLNDFVDYFGEGKGTVAWVGSLLSGMYLSAGPVVSALANKYGCRAVCIAGSVISCVAFALSTLSPNVTVMMLTYGVMGGIGFGFIYLPAVVAVGYYFETKRSLATGIAVCGSGVGTFVFAPLANMLLANFDWKNSTLILAGLILNCAIFGAMMRPLTYPKEDDKVKPLMQRMYEEKRMQMERGSIGGSYFMVQLPDGTMEKRLKAPLNADPGVHSSLALDQLAGQQGMTAVATLPTITEAKVQEQNGSSSNSSSESGQIEMKKPLQRKRTTNSESDANEYNANNMPRNASQPAFTSNQSGIPKNGSVPTFDRVRKHSTGERFKPSLAAIKASSRGDVGSNGDVRKTMHLKLSRGSFIGSKNNNAEDFDDSVMYTSKASLKADRPQMVRPLSRKDIFYSGSVTNLKEFQSQKSLASYRNSVISLTKFEREHRERDVVREDLEKGTEQYDLCPCLVLPESFKNAIGAMMDMSLLRDPVFMMIAISNIFGMAGLYVPFVYLVDAAVLDGIEESKATFLISIIGITNTFARILCGYVADFPKVDALFMNNVCLVISTFAVSLTPFCHSYYAYVAMAIAFGIAVAGYISLTSIILVDLLGLDKLTNAFGLLILFRGAATIVGSPLAGALYDATQTYSIPFFVAGGLFGLSAIFSFAAPATKRFRKQEEAPVHVEVLTPIDEEPSEDLADDDQPITILPKIVQTAPSPSTEQPITSSLTSAINNDKQKPANGNSNSKEISQMESVL